MNHVKRSFFIMLAAIVCTITDAQHNPRLTVIFVIDQLPYRIMHTLMPHLHGGIKYLMQRGISFSNAYYPHAIPETTPGHTALNTGAFACYHGIISNSWLTPDGTYMSADYDTVERAAVFGRPADMQIGRSGAHIMVDGISDQIVLHPSPHADNTVIALSIKSSAAIGCAGQLGKAIWFDEDTGKFTSSKAYFDTLPSWISSFNEKNILPQEGSVSWRLLYNPLHDAYTFARNSDYGVCASPARAGKSVAICDIRSDTGKESYSSYVKTPQAVKLLLDLARSCINHHLSSNKDDKLVVWISISSTDLIGHEYGTQSIEYLDMVYHVDYQLKKFIRRIQRWIKSSDILWALTSDHASAPIPELMQQDGYHKARRINSVELTDTINKQIAQRHGAEGIVNGIYTNNVYLNTKKLSKLDPTQQNTIITDIKSLLRATPGIKQVWTYDELDAVYPDMKNFDYYVKQQRYPGRSGDIIVQVEPYCFITKYPHGTSHATPYNYDTHVPLVLYQKYKLEHKIINENIFMTQFAPTIAQLLNVPKPSACRFEFLPGIIPNIEILGENS